MIATAIKAKWVCIESEAMDSANWIQVAYRSTMVEREVVREYKVFGEIQNEEFAEDFMGSDSKELAYQYYYGQFSIIEYGSISCDDCQEYATTTECVNAITQTGGYCLGCADTD